MKRLKNKNKRLIKGSVIVNYKNPYKWDIHNRVSEYNETFKNEVDEILQDTEFKLIQNKSSGVLYYFEILQPTNISNYYVLPKGEYVLKIEVLTDDLEVKNLKKLSDLNLIPKIYFIKLFSDQWNDLPNYYGPIDHRYIFVMDYINGEDLAKLIAKNKWKLNFKDMGLRNYIYDRIKKEFKRWGDNIHGDLNPRNILITRKGEIYFIDPLSFTLRKNASGISEICRATKNDDIVDLKRIQDILIPLK